MKEINPRGPPLWPLKFLKEYDSVIEPRRKRLTLRSVGVYTELVEPDPLHQTTSYELYGRRLETDRGTIYPRIRRDARYGLYLRSDGREERDGTILNTYHWIPDWISLTQ